MSDSDTTAQQPGCSCSKDVCAGETAGFWMRRGREIMCAAGGLFLLIGFIFHTVRAGFINALAGEEISGQIEIAAYLVAVAVSWWYVAPNAYRSLRRMQADINLLMTIAVIGAIAIGEFLEAATVSFLYALSLLMESWSVGRARKAIGALLDLKPPSARIVADEGSDIREIPAEQVALQATVQVRPGEKIPLDGIVTKGTTSIDQSPITGESVPVSKKAGDQVYAGTINNEGAFEFLVTRTAYDTALARIIRMVEEAQSRRAPVEQWIQKFARFYTPLMLLGAVLVATVPPLLFSASWNIWIYNALVMLVISCPCAMLVSTSVSVMAALTSAARVGVLIKGGIYLEIPAHLRALAIDKTGTLTHGRPEVITVEPFNDHTPEEILTRAASLEALSEHPLAQAVVRTARDAGVSLEPVDDFRIIRGKGAEAILDGRLFWIGSHRFLHERAVEEEAFHLKALDFEAAGQSVVAVGNDNHICGLISIGDRVRENSAEIVAGLRESGIDKVVMLTGDNEGTARAVAGASGIDEYQAELLPEDKVAAVRKLVERYRAVAMVGDGVNDAPALAAATIGIAMGAAGADAAIETADVALMSDDLTRLPWLIHHSRRTLRMVKENVLFALGVKALFMTLAFFNLATLWMAIFADMGVTLLVVFNSLRLLNPKLNS
ncbi:MAG: heavy metal translocating P-type ATPase [Candidatus Zixiibacteriota bacterium]|nr:MAG: heavy metal translocating P-type ATPase [candidate division Zixibacteria bacterium]